MINRKGMSQVLSLIVAAAVLMMTALTVIFLASGSLGNFGEDTRGSACTNTIQTQCQVQGGAGTVDIPGSCYADGEDGELTNAFTYTETGDGEVQCSSVIN